MDDAKAVILCYSSGVTTAGFCGPELSGIVHWLL